MTRININSIPQGQPFDICTISISNGTQTANAYLIMYVNSLNADFADLICKAINKKNVFTAKCIGICTTHVGDANCQTLQNAIANLTTGGVVDVRWVKQETKLQAKDDNVNKDYFQVQLPLYGDNLSKDILFDAELFGASGDVVEKNVFNQHKQIADTVETRIDKFFGVNIAHAPNIHIVNPASNSINAMSINWSQGNNNLQSSNTTLQSNITTKLQSRNNLIKSVIDKNKNWEIDKIINSRIDVIWVKDRTFMKYGVASIDISKMSSLRVLYSTQFTAKLSNELMKTFMANFKNTIWRTIMKELHKQKGLYPSNRTKHIKTGLFLYQL